MSFTKPVCSACCNIACLSNSYSGFAAAALRGVALTRGRAAAAVAARGAYASAAAAAAAAALRHPTALTAAPAAAIPYAP